jgi:hypothetical protein
MKRLSFCVIILAGISVSAQVQPYSSRSTKKEVKTKAVLDTSQLDTIMNTHQELQKLLRAEMQMKDPE